MKPQNHKQNTLLFLVASFSPVIDFFLQHNNIPEILVELTVFSIWLQINLQCEAIIFLHSMS